MDDEFDKLGISINIFYVALSTLNKQWQTQHILFFQSLIGDEKQGK